MIEDKIIKDAFDNVEPKGFPHFNKHWETLFAAYAEKTGIRLGHTCFPCFSKVYFYFKKYFGDTTRNKSGHESTGGAVSQPGATTASHSQTGRKSFIGGKTGKAIFHSRTILGRRPN